jgi:hypothetical protein
MPRIFDNIEQPLLNALKETLGVSYRADFCSGYMNLRGWRLIDETIRTWPGREGRQCRVLVGMQRTPQEQVRALFASRESEPRMDNATANQILKRMAQEMRDQLVVGAPTNADEEGLRRLACELRGGQVVVKLFLRHPLHAKLYLLYRQDYATPLIGYLGSSNLTFSGLQGQGELNVDVVEQDAAYKLATWFEERWNDRWCVDISERLADIIDESWATEKLIPPYHIYLNMAYHLSREARAGISEFRIPRALEQVLLDFQVAAVKIAARHLNQRRGVLIGDVVGLGKTLMATAVAKVFQEDMNADVLVICPKNIVRMWQTYLDDYQLRGHVLSLSAVQTALDTLRRYQIVILDESHNLRNPEGKRYRAIRDYIQRNESRCILLSATPYNKTYGDLAAQLGLFIPEDTELGIRPERLLRSMTEIEFRTRHQCSPSTLAAFQKSEYPDDWRSLLTRYMVRRTRTFIRDNYAKPDPQTGRMYLQLSDGTRSGFPDRIPRTERFQVDDANANDPYARLYSDRVVDAINGLRLPRYGLAPYLDPKPVRRASLTEERVIADLSRAGRRLMGFCRTNLYKRLESSGEAFMLSLQRHILRNHVFLYALDHGLPLPIGTQGAEMLDTRFEDEDPEAVEYTAEDLFDDDTERDAWNGIDAHGAWAQRDFARRGHEVYELYRSSYERRFRWIGSDLFRDDLKADLLKDAEELGQILAEHGPWKPEHDAKLAHLEHMLTNVYPTEKVLIFSQFADTVLYLERELKACGITRLAGVTGTSADPTEMARRFSPVSNQCEDEVAPGDELRCLIATDVLSEGQNLQDGHIVVNYDLPWAIIRLVQRAGRVDRIGQRAERIICHSFWPAQGVELILRLRSRLRQRLRENAEVVGSDEAYFEDDGTPQPLLDLYHEKAGILDDEPDSEVDLVSYAYQVWKNAIDADPSLEKKVAGLPPVVYSTKAWDATPDAPAGVLVYVKTGERHSALGWVSHTGEIHSASPMAVLRAAACTPHTPALPRLEVHHDLVQAGVDDLTRSERFIGGQLGSPQSARFRTYTRLERYARELERTLFGRTDEAHLLYRAVEQIYRYPLRPVATDTLNRQLRSQISDEDLAELVVHLYEDGRLCQVEEERESEEPVIICSMGLASQSA